MNHPVQGAVGTRVQKLLDDRRLLLPVLLTAVAIAVGSVLVIVLTGGSSGSGSAAAPSSRTAGGGAGGAVTVDITDFKFMPPTVTVKAGSKVSWVNKDAAQHTATAAGAFDTSTLQKGATKAVKLDKPGTYAYVCEFHPFMKGTVVVK